MRALVTVIKGILVLLAAVPLSVSALVSIPIDRTGRAFHGSGRLWSKFILWIFGIHVHVKGFENLEKGNHYVYVANHASWFDIPSVMVGIPDDIRIVLKKELTWIPLWGWALRFGPYISIDRTSPKDAIRGLEKAAHQIRNGASVLLFAEGTRTKNGKLQPFKRGAFALAAKSGVPIIPVTINNSYQILPKGSFKVQPSDIIIVLEEPILTTGREGKEGEKTLMDEVRVVITRNFVEPVG